MDASLSRRHFLSAAALLPALALPGCATTLGDLGPQLEFAVRRLLTAAAQGAFVRLLVREGFFSDEVARVTLPPELGGTRAGAALGILLQSGLVREELLRLVNRAAEAGARAAEPFVFESIRSMRIVDALAIVHGGPTAGTDYLAATVGDRILEVLSPGVVTALRVDNGVLNRALAVATGIDFDRLQSDVSRKAAGGIYRAMGREEAAIRANPRATGDPLLIRMFGRGY